MENLKQSKSDLLEEFKDINNKSKHKLKLIISITIIILFILGFIIMIILLILQSKKIKKLTEQIKDLTNQFDKDIPYLKNKTIYLFELNDKINRTESQLIEKDKEIQSIKVNLQHKEKEAKLFDQNLNNLNKLMNDNIDNIQINLRHKDEEIELLKKASSILNNSNLIIYKNINNIENELIQKNKEIGICSNNLNLLNNKIINNYKSLNRNFAEIQSLKNLESNMNLLVDFKVRIKADFYIGDQQAQLCSFKIQNSDIIDDSRIRLCGFKNGDSGCVWIVHQNGKFFEFTLTDSKYGMNDWKIEINYDKPFCTNKIVGSIFILEEGSLHKYYKIKNKDTGEYLFINPDSKRNDASYYVDLTTRKNIATDFYFAIYQE